MEGGYCYSGGASTCYTGSQFRIEHIWCNPCLNNGLTVHDIDNPLLVDHWEFTPSWYFSNAAVGNYVRQNAVGIDLHYSAAPQFANLDFFGLKSGITAENDTVTNNFGNVTLAVSFGQFTNIMFNQVCQAVTLPNENGTNAGAAFVNVAVWGDQSGFECSKGLPMFALGSNFANFSMTHIQVYYVDTFAEIGCGANGSSACGTTSGGGILRIDDIDVQCYSCFSANNAFVLAPSNAYVGFGITNLAAIRPGTTYAAGKLMGPGPDGSQAYMGCLEVGGGTKSLEGGVALCGSQDTVHSGQLEFFTPDNTYRGTMGYADTGGMHVSSTGNLYLESHNGSQDIYIQQDSSGKAQIILGNLPTTCTSEPSGTLYNSSGIVHQCP